MGIDDFDTFRAHLSSSLPLGGTWSTGLSAEEVNSPDFGAVANAVADRLRDLIRRREVYLRRLLARRLPQRLTFLLDHPRLLALCMRVTPARWWPEIRIADLTSGGPMTEGAAAMMARAWVVANPGRNGHATYDALVVRYLDVTALPAEIYGGPAGPVVVDSLGVLDLTESGRLTSAEVDAVILDAAMSYRPDFVVRITDVQLAHLQAEANVPAYAPYLYDSDRLTVYGHPVEILET